jgi:hypothetical protein
VIPANRFHTLLNSMCKKIAINKEYPLYIKDFNHFIQCDLSIDNPLENIDIKDL